MMPSSQQRRGFFRHSLGLYLDIRQRENTRQAALALTDGKGCKVLCPQRFPDIGQLCRVKIENNGFLSRELR
jgi:hypothetical protein